MLENILKICLKKVENYIGLILFRPGDQGGVLYLGKKVRSALGSERAKNNPHKLTL